MKCVLIVGAALLSVAFAQRDQYTTPVPILKQINKHNEDGSYSYGYEGADGTFKIETKYPDGEVYGKYGYVDDSGKIREVEYGASRRGFEPAGRDINVAPPTLRKNNNVPLSPLGPQDEDDGQYREDPSVYYKNDPYSQPAYKQPAYKQPAYKQPAYQQPAYQQPAYKPSYTQPRYQQPEYRPQPQPAFRPEPQSNQFDFVDNFRNYQPAPPQPRYQPQHYNPPPPPPPPRPTYNNYNYNPAPAPAYDSNFFRQPAQNVDLNTGSYTLNYSG